MNLEILHGTKTYNFDAERALLGCILRDGSALGDVCEMLKSTDFYSKAHAAIYEAMCAIAVRGESTTVDAVNRECMDTCHAEWLALGAHDFIHLLWNVVPSGTNAVYYAAIVVERAAARKIAATTRKAAGVIVNDSEDALISALYQRVERLESIVAKLVEIGCRN